MKKTFDEKNIETILKYIDKPAAAVPSHAFTAGVMDRIRSEEAGPAYFESIYRKFLIAASIAAAAAVILAVNFISSYNSFASEYAMMDILNGTIF